MIVAGAVAVRCGAQRRDSPAVTVIRIRARAGRPAAVQHRRHPGPDLVQVRLRQAQPAAEAQSRARCRVSANGTPPGDLERLEHPVPGGQPVIGTDTRAWSSGTRVPFIHTVTGKR